MTSRPWTCSAFWKSGSSAASNSDYFTLDTGWMDHASDLTRFAPQCYPTGPAKIVERVKPWE